MKQCVALTLDRFYSSFSYQAAREVGYKHTSCLVILGDYTGNPTLALPAGTFLSSS